MSIPFQERKLLSEFMVDHLGTSFEVVLVNSAWKDGQDTVIPNQFGLYKSIARLRVLDARKLTGRDIVFLRKTLGFKAKDFAASLDISAEYLSRCEAGDKILSSQIEKVLRLTVLSELLRMAEEGAGSARRAMPIAFKVRWADDVRELISLRVKAVTDTESVRMYRLRHFAPSAASAARVDQVLPIAACEEWDRTAACA